VHGDTPVKGHSRILGVGRLPSTGTLGDSGDGFRVGHSVLDLLWVAATCHARAPAGSQVRSMTADSMDSNFPSQGKPSRISSRVTDVAPSHLAGGR